MGLHSAKSAQSKGLEDKFTQISFSRKKGGAPRWDLPTWISIQRKEFLRRAFPITGTTKSCCTGAGKGPSGPHGAQEDPPRSCPCSEVRERLRDFTPAKGREVDRGEKSKDVVWHKKTKRRVTEAEKKEGEETMVSSS
jgi:hypothetical protein